MFCGKVRVLMLKGEKGEAGTSGDYSALTNKPQINGVTLSGNMTPATLGLMTQTQASQFQTDLSDLSGRVTNLGTSLNNLAQDVENYYATTNYVDTAIANAITNAISGSY